MGGQNRCKIARKGSGIVYQHSPIPKGGGSTGGVRHHPGTDAYDDSIMDFDKDMARVWKDTLKGANAMSFLRAVHKQLSADYKTSDPLDSGAKKKRQKLMLSALQQRQHAEHNMAMHRLYGHERMSNLKELADLGYVDGLVVKGDGKIGFRASTRAHAVPSTNM